MDSSGTIIVLNPIFIKLLCLEIKFKCYYNICNPKSVMNPKEVSKIHLLYRR